MKKMILAAFDSQESADRAIRQLETMGYDADDMSIISKETKTRETQELADGPTEGAVTGATTGGALGGLAGLLAGAGVIPALAGLFIGGPIAAALGATGIAATAISGAVTGALAGGLIGALTQLGVPEDVARSYDETIESGGYVVGVPTNTDDTDEARDILIENGAEDITEVELREHARM